MNYIWEMALQANEQGIRFEDICFSPAKQASPYMEAAFPIINTSELDTQPIEINTLYRFYPIFAPLLNRDYGEYDELRETLFDILLHELALLDLRRGLSRQEFYMLFLAEDIRAGFFGEDYQDVLESFSVKERTWLLSCMAKLYQLGNSIELFREVIRVLYPASIVYFFTDAAQEILLYIGKRETDTRYKQISFICKVFLSADIRIYLYWLHHFGILGYDETLQMGEIIIF